MIKTLVNKYSYIYMGIVTSLFIILILIILLKEAILHPSDQILNTLPLSVKDFILSIPIFCFLSSIY